MNAIETRIVLCCTILLFFAPKHGFAETTKSTEQYLAEFKQALGLHERRHLVKEVFSLPDVKKKKEILLKVAYFLNDFLAERINTRKMDDEYYQYQEFGNMVVWTLVYQHLPTDPKEFLPLEAKELEPLLGQPLPITPEEYLGDVMGDLNSRRGKIEGFSARKDAQVIKATVPLSEMFGYATILRSMTQGRAIFTMQFLRYSEVPKSLSDEIAEKSLGKKAVTTA